MIQGSRIGEVDAGTHGTKLFALVRDLPVRAWGDPLQIYKLDPCALPPKFALASPLCCLLFSSRDAKNPQKF